MRADVREHPAVRAWIKLQLDRVEPEGIEILDRKRRAWIELRSEHAGSEGIETLDTKERARIKFRSERVRAETTDVLKRKKFLYRLKGVGPGGSNVIAKQCEKGDGMLQLTIYKEILSRLTIPTLACFGFVEEPGGVPCWLFLEDAGTDKFSFRIREHRALAARWLGRLHTSAARVGATARLPERGPGRYLEHLQSARDKIGRAIADAPLSPDDLVVLESIVSRCDALESRWSKVERFCDRMPQTLVHSDFRRSNIRVRDGQSGTTIVPFDWEMAGRGIPAADLAHLEEADLVIYGSVVRRSWPYLLAQHVRQMVDLGRVFWALAYVDWRSWPLTCAWDRPPLEHGSPKDEAIMLDMRIAGAGLADAMRAAALEDRGI